MEYKIEYVTNPNSVEIDFIKNKLKDYNDQFVGNDDYQPLNIIVNNENGKMIGGLTGCTSFQWLYIDRFWINENHRRKGLGKEMLKRAEAEAIKRGCENVHLDTFDFQAPEFYKKNGYKIKYKWRDLPKGHSKYIMWKKLKNS